LKGWNSSNTGNNPEMKKLRADQTQVMLANSVQDLLSCCCYPKIPR